MEDVNLIAGIIGGFMGGIVMTAMMNAAKKMGITEMDMVLMQGAMVTGDRQKAKLIGLFAHLVMMSAIVFGIIYALLFAALDVAPSDAWWYGALFGLVHSIVAAIGITMMPMMHPRMGSEPPKQPGEVHMGDPGLFGKNYGAMTPMGIVVAHMLYGLVLGLVYWWLA